MYNGHGPAWLNVLAAAEEWGTPPWDIAGGHKLTWYMRWLEYKKAVAQKQRLDNGK